jgi:hypothetical protein
MTPNKLSLILIISLGTIGLASSLFAIAVAVVSLLFSSDRLMWKVIGYAGLLIALVSIVMIIFGIYRWHGLKWTSVGYAALLIALVFIAVIIFCGYIWRQ